MLMMVLVVLSLLIGVQVSDGMRESIGAFAIIGIIVVLFVIVFLGERCWHLAYFIPVIAINMPVMGGALSILMPTGMLAAGSLLFIWAVMRTIGQASFRWRAAPALDIAVVLLTICFIASYIMHPTGIRAFDSEYVGGKEYVWAFAAFLFYITISSISGSAEDIIRTSYRSFFVLMGAQIVYNLMTVANGSFFSILRAASEGYDARFILFQLLGPSLMCYVYCSASLMAILTSWRRLGMFFFGVLLTLLCGRRELFVEYSMALVFVAFLKKELSVAAGIGLFLYSFILFLGFTHVLELAPVSVQRTLYVLPGVQIEARVAGGTQGSSETRLALWRLALDTRTGYIRDYIWGDGYQLAAADLNRAMTAAMRGSKELINLSNEQGHHAYARLGNWHNGFISTVHRIGIVGLVLVNFVFIVGVYLTARIFGAYRRRRELPALMALTLHFAAFAFAYPWGSANLLQFFGCYVYLGIIKMLYCAARELHMLPPSFFAPRYVPMMIAEAEKRGGIPQAV